MNVPRPGLIELVDIRIDYERRFAAAEREQYAIGVPLVDEAVSIAIALRRNRDIARPHWAAWSQPARRTLADDRYRCSRSDAGDVYPGHEGIAAMAA